MYLSSSPVMDAILSCQQVVMALDFNAATSTTVPDLSGQNNSGINTAVGLSMLSPVVNEMSGRFDGSTSFLNCGVIDLPGVMSAMAWIRADDVSGTKNFMGNSDATAATYDYGFQLANANVRVIWAGNVAATSTATVKAAAWYHVAFVRTGSAGAWAVKLYINGALDSTTTGIAFNPNGASSNTGVGRIGADRATNSFVGRLVYPALGTAAWTANQIMRVYKAGEAMIPSRTATIRRLILQGA